MSALLWAVVLLSQLALVASQILMKQAMTSRGQKNPRWRGDMTAAMAVVVIWLLLWLGAMPRLELSKLVPFEGISPILIVLGAALFLGERLPWRAWAGLLLTCVGIVMVSAS